MESPTTPHVVGRGGTATRCEGLPLGEPAQARRVTTMWQSQSSEGYQTYDNYKQKQDDDRSSCTHFISFNYLSM